MEHVGIDLGGSKSQVCVRAADNTVLLERTVATISIGELMRERPQSRVILETCAEAFAVADKIRSLNPEHEVRIVPATLAKTLGIGSRGVKNDRKDARCLSEVSVRIDLPSVHVPSMLSRDIKSLCACRDGLVHSRTQLINVVRGWMRTKLIRIPAGATYTFPTRLRDHAIGVALPSFITTTLQAIDTLSAQLDALDLEVSALAKTHKTCELLMSAPGVGPVTAVRFLAAIDDCARFPSASALTNYLGLTPGEHRSSTRGHRTGITKAGPNAVRSCLVQCAWSAWRTAKSDPNVQWAQGLAARSKNKNIAIIALARKLAGILFAIWRHGRPYDPNYGRGSLAA